MAKRFLSHWLKVVDEHSLQAPFIYDFYTQVVKHKPESQKLLYVQELRRNLLKDQTTIEVTDFGTGNDKHRRRTICDLVKKSNQIKVSQLLYNIADRYKPMVIVELGTSLGLGTLHLAAAAPLAKIITIEGCPETSEKAQCNFQAWDLNKYNWLLAHLNKPWHPCYLTSIELTCCLLMPITNTVPLLNTFHCVCQRFIKKALWYWRYKTLLCSLP